MEELRIQDLEAAPAFLEGGCGALLSLDVKCIRV